jgi:hypothetical protein
MRTWQSQQNYTAHCVPPCIQNLTPTQKKTLNLLKHSKEFVAMPTDKNLGPSIMNCEAYIEQVLNLQLSPRTAKHQLNQTKHLLMETFNPHQNSLSQPEIDYFTRSFKNRH